VVLQFQRSKLIKMNNDWLFTRIYLVLLYYLYASVINSGFIIQIVCVVTYLFSCTHIHTTPPFVFKCNI